MRFMAWIPVAALAATLPLEKDVKPVEVVRVPSYSEGIVFDREGNGYISHGKFISKVTPDGKASIWAETGFPDGHRILGDGTHLVAEANQHAVVHLDAQGKTIGKIGTDPDGKPLRAPNDIALDPDHGGYYFTDPDLTEKEPVGTVFWVDRDNKIYTVADKIFYPNGIVLRPGGKKLIVGESLRNRILEFDVISPGKVANMRVFAQLPAKQGDQIDNQPDGMCLDNGGNLYVAHYGMRQVQVIDPNGKVIRHYPAGNLTASNVAFGGPSMDDLYITGAIAEENKSEGVLFRLHLPGVHGLNILPKR